MSDQLARIAQIKAIEKSLDEERTRHSKAMRKLLEEQAVLFGAPGCTHKEADGRSSTWAGMYERGCHYCDW